MPKVLVSGNRPPVIRAITHRLLQALNTHIEGGKVLSISGNPITLNLQPGETYAAVVSNWLRQVPLLRSASELTGSPENIGIQSLLEMHLPRRLDIKESGTGKILSVEGQPLQALYGQAIRSGLDTLEAGKAPYLALLNSGKVVPLVFGFSPIKALKTHTVKTFSGRHLRYSYQDEDHALAGSANGGRLLEIEARDLQDLATLALGMRVKGASLPEDTNTAIRLRASRNSQTGAKQGKAIYLSAEHFTGFRGKLDQWLESQHIEGELSEQPLAQLQALNKTLRAAPLQTWVGGVDDEAAS
ncbi:MULTISPECIES: hypothetical protein [Pseudomonas]|uniref:Uncharacterized protein n=1 Tax=Pseudomonas quercus TaxID=2722792 RepID=A0ABX0YER8_9PSED|nr:MULTISPECIES: hypothetical protein [Pseudomonas]MBF7142219.1 hypothetical protein [Pseudomonas sp. LY10J]NJP00757.1 hypothetical protein [Pseudomonas quercus]